MKTLTILLLILLGCSSKETKGEFNEDGSHRKFTEWLKREMNDPESYEHIYTMVEKRSGYTMLMVEFRANNAFGAKVKDKIFARISSEGEVEETAEDDVWLLREIHGDVRSEEEKFLESLDSAYLNARKAK